MFLSVGKGLLMNHVQRVPYYGVLSSSKAFELLFFDPKGINWDRGMVEGIHLKQGLWQRGDFPFPKTVFNRCYPAPSAVIDRLKEVIGSENIFNTITQFDKWDVYQCLSSSEIKSHLPLTYQYTEENLSNLLEDYKDIILKPKLGYGGLGVLRVTKLSPSLVMLGSYLDFPVPMIGEELYLAILLALAPPEGFIGQRYIDSLQTGDYKFDIRIVMQKDLAGSWQVGGQLSRVTKVGKLLTNDYIAILDPHYLVPSTLLSTIYSISEVVACELEEIFEHLGEISIDFFLDRDKKPWILEVNGKPDKSLFVQLGDPKMLQTVYLKPLEYQRFLLDQTKSK